MGIKIYEKTNKNRPDPFGSPLWLSRPLWLSVSPNSLNGHYVGASFEDYMLDQAQRRDSFVFITDVSKVTYDIMLNEAKIQAERGRINAFPDNCAGRTATVNNAGGFIPPPPVYIHGDMSPPPMDYNLPIQIYWDMKSRGGSEYQIKRGSRSIPDGLLIFNSTINK